MMRVYVCTLCTNSEPNPKYNDGILSTFIIVFVTTSARYSKKLSVSSPKQKFERKKYIYKENQL